MKSAKKRAKRARPVRDTKTPVLIPQSNGAGALLSGGMPGNAGGSGRPPSVVRMRARDSFYDRIPILEGIADKTDATDEQKISAIDKLGKYGLSGSVSADDVRERLKATLQEVRSTLPPDQAEMLIGRIKPHWMAA